MSPLLFLLMQFYFRHLWSRAWQKLWVSDSAVIATVEKSNFSFCSNNTGEKSCSFCHSGSFNTFALSEEWGFIHCYLEYRLHAAFYFYSTHFAVEYMEEQISPYHLNSFKVWAIKYHLAWQWTWEPCSSASQIICRAELLIIGWKNTTINKEIWKSSFNRSCVADKLRLYSGRLMVSLLCFIYNSVTWENNKLNSWFPVPLLSVWAEPAGMLLFQVIWVH